MTGRTVDSGRDPVSWTMVEPGWRVVGRTGTDLGAVREVLGDVQADIFSGLRVSPGSLSLPVYVPAERVAEIREGEIVLAGDSL